MLMAYVAIFIIAAILEIISAALIFWFKDILHTVLALSFVFIINSAFFLMLNQPLLALLQLFIMVGGVSTYVFVGVSSASFSKFSHTNYIILAIASIAILALFSYKIIPAGTQVNQQNLLSSSLIAQALGSNAVLLYLIGIFVFGAGYGSVILMRKLGEKN